MSLLDSFSELAGAASDAYAADRAASAARQNANAANAGAMASIMSSRNLMIAGVVVAVAIVAFIFLRPKS